MASSLHKHLASLELTCYPRSLSGSHPSPFLASRLFAMPKTLRLQILQTTLLNCRDSEDLKSLLELYLGSAVTLLSVSFKAATHHPSSEEPPPSFGLLYHIWCRTRLALLPAWNLLKSACTSGLPILRRQSNHDG